MATEGNGIEESKDLSTLHLDELIGTLKVFKVVLEKDSEASKNKKEKYKSLDLKAKKEKGRFVQQPHEDKKAFWKVKEDKNRKVDRKCFKCGDLNHFISDCPKHSYNDQKAFVRGSWSDSDEDVDLKNDEICLMARESNKVINKNKLSKTKNELLDNDVFKLKERLKKLEKNKALDEVSLTSEVKSTKTIEKADKKASDVPYLADPFERDLASTVEGIRASDATGIKLKSSKHLKLILFK
ncbi:zf-CCHC domain-containing protein [Tanacetum coccineum]